MHETDVKRKEMGWKYIWTKNDKIYRRKHEGTKAVIIQQAGDLNNIYWLPNLRASYGTQLCELCNNKVVCVCFCIITRPVTRGAAQGWPNFP